MGEARHVAKEATDAFNAHDAERIRALYADSAKFEAPGGATGGAEEATAYTMGWLNGFPDARATVRNEIISGDWVVHELTFTGTHEEALVGPGGVIPATGKQVTGHGIDLFRVEGGKIVEERLYFDQIEILSQLGVTPAPVTA
jgi:steroid delta-isomerase-like uncharacterized protein